MAKGTDENRGDIRSMAEVKGRKYWCDMLRALAILFVVGTHAMPAGTMAKIVYNQFVGSIMIPLFFAISGYIFPGNDCSWKRFCLSLLKKIIVPTIFLSFVWINLLKIPFAGVG